jgi:CheY-like chemotaxis protein
VLNLVVNARDAMPQGGTLSIAVNEIDLPDGDELPADRYVRIVIRDTGSGMDAATLQKATEPFFSTKELGKGTGLGLSMVHGLAVQLHGALRLHSQIGVGTTAELWLPRTALAVEEETSPALAPKDIGIGKITILVVDDDALIAMSTVDMLEDLGHDVIEANSGEGALDILKDGRAVDLLITDYSMPRMNGAQLASAARSLRPDLPILLATGYAELPEGSSLDLPRLAKPYQQNQLAAEVAKLVRHERQLAASR